MHGVENGEYVMNGAITRIEDNLDGLLSWALPVSRSSICES